MKIISNKKTGKEMHLTSWVNGEDPRLGIFSMGLDPNRHQFYIWKGNEPYMRSNVYATTSSYTTHYNQGLSAYFAFDVQEDGVSLVYTLSKNTQVLIHREQYLASEPVRPGKNKRNKGRKLDSGNQVGQRFRESFQKKKGDQRFRESESIKRKLTRKIRKKKREEEREIKAEAASFDSQRTITLSPSRQIQVLIWEQTAWKVQSQVPISTCDFYGYCGPFTVCEKNDPVSVYALDDIQEHQSTHIRKSSIAVAVAIFSIGLLIISVFGYFGRRDRLIMKERIERELLGFDSICCWIFDEVV
ncbi:S-locus glycoprotein domain-containing protein [Artemisia annua]|uniref:S-locus glycoprotein domain-containing protein n=1 Tax=Artemisia annua TaxID=35608 RepID=A0A2U1MQ11_ARTAN|nr:S-locus glycoprotein domain-containing protein [Artemisia annua]